LVVYRDRSETEVRDISYVLLEQGKWSGPKTLHHDGWEIPACPVNGPAAAADGDRVVVSWFTMAPRPMVLAAFSVDGGRTFDKPVRVDEGSPLGRVDVVWLETGNALLSWLEKGEGASADLWVRPATTQGSNALRFLVAKTSSSRATGFPRMARRGKEVLVAWTDVENGPRIRVAALFH
jgi:hypothetical protein